METISVIIPIYRRWDLAQNRLWELYHNSEYHRHFLQVVLADDCSQDKQVDNGLKFWERSGTFSNLKIIVNSHNLGFGGNLQNAYEQSDGEIVVFHSTDVQILGDYLKEIRAALTDKEKERLVGGRLLDWDTGWNKFGNRLFPYLEGWMLACRRNVWDKIGGWNPMYYPYDFEDMEASTVALEMGIELFPLNSPNLVHSGGATIYSVHGVDARREVTNRNKIKFEEKWITKQNEN